jgi:arylsulfatase A-like enzyme
MAQQVPALDVAIGRVLGALGDDADDTVVVFLSDNGYEYGEHRSFQKSLPYEESIRVPFVIRYPRLVDADDHRHTDALVANLDVTPTVLDLAGVAWAGDGRSLVPLLRDPRATVRSAVLEEWCAARAARCVGSMGPHDPPPYHGVVTADHAYFEYATGERHLFDLGADPDELHNQAGAPGAAADQARLAATLRGLLAPPANPDTTVATGPGRQLPRGRADFVFFSADLTTTFRCRLARVGAVAAWEPCPLGRRHYDGLAAGRYRFDVEAVDGQGHVDPSPAGRTFVVPSPPATTGS